MLTAAAWLRGAEYDEQYTLFLTAGVARPDWPAGVFPAGTIAAVQAGHAGFTGIAQDLRATDVHPPFYFWAVSLWRTVFGPGLFAVRLFSVVCGTISLWLTGRIASRCGIRPATAMLLLLGCYGFVYTNAIARGFAPAQALTLCGVCLLPGRHRVLAGICLGAACCCNYLAVFVSVAAVVATGAWAAVPGAIPFLALDAWFFAAQHASRSGQFPPFDIWRGLTRLAQYQTGAVFGGLPLYADGIARIAIGAAIGLVSAGLVAAVSMVRPMRAGAELRTIVAGAIAPPLGLLMLGAVFNNTPIELRYLSFGLPFVALLAAWRFGSDNPGVRHACSPGPGTGKSSVAEPAPVPAWAWTRQRARGFCVPLSVVAAIQIASIAGLLIAPRTMQPARAAAVAAAGLVADGVVLVPRGNDSVGIPGAFGIEAPASLPIRLIRPDDRVATILAQYRRVTLAELTQDSDSTAAVALWRAALSGPDWRRVAIGSSVEVFERNGAGE